VREGQRSSGVAGEQGRSGRGGGARARPEVPREDEMGGWVGGWVGEIKRRRG
jgi:hypothetical protein